MDARLRKMQKEHTEFQILYNRLFMAAMNANPKVEKHSCLNPQNAAAEYEGGEGHKSDAEVIALVPTSNPVEAEEHTSGPRIVR